MVTATTTDAVAEADTEAARSTVADMAVIAVTIVTVAMAETVTITPLVESIATLVTTDIAAVATMTDVEEEVDTLIVMTEATVAPLATHRQQPPPMVIQLLVERLGNHTEVEATTMRGFPVVNIDC